MVTYSFSVRFFKYINGRYDNFPNHYEIFSFDNLETAKSVQRAFKGLEREDALNRVRGYKSKYEAEKFQEYLKNLETPIDFVKTIRKIKETIRNNKPITEKLFKDFLNYYNGRNVSSKTVLRFEKVISGFIYTLNLPVDKNTQIESYISKIYEMMFNDFIKNFYKMDIKEFTEYIKDGNKFMYKILSAIKKEDLLYNILKHREVETSKLLETEIITS